jgi:hypothetical protein
MLTKRNFENSILDYLLTNGDSLEVKVFEKNPPFEVLESVVFSPES